MRQAGLIAGLAAAALGLAGCGRPEAEGPSAAASAPQTPAALPAYPAWSTPMIGRLVSQVLNGRVTCTGAFDGVTLRHTGAHPGVEVGGWGWNVADKSPVDRVVFVDAADRIVGAGDGGVARPDVPKALPDVTSGRAGWHGVIGRTSGPILVLGVTPRSAACNVAAGDIGG